MKLPHGHTNIPVATVFNTLMGAKAELADSNRISIETTRALLDQNELLLAERERLQEKVSRAINCMGREKDEEAFHILMGMKK